MEREAVAKVIERVRRERMFTPGEPVVVGCSGGADSTALLYVLGSGLLGFPLACTAVYVDHGIRRETEAERALVAEAAARVGARFVVRQVDVPAAKAAAGGSLQEVARRLRYEALREEAERRGARRIAVGHTQSDRAETLLLQLLRGAGVRGLAAIPPVRGAVVRPLIDLSRAETEAICRAYGLRWFDDPSNVSDSYLRNRVRRELIPHLRRYNPRIEEILARTAEILRADEEYLEEAAEAAYQAAARPGPDGAGVTLACDGLRSLPLALARRVVRRALREAGGEEEGGRATFAQVEAILALAESTEGSAAFHGLGGIRVEREYGRLRFYPVRPASPGLTGPGGGEGGEGAAGEPPTFLAVPGVTPIPWAGCRIAASVAEAGPDPAAAVRRAAPNCAVLDYDAVALPLVARSRRPHDVLRPLGAGGRKKVKELFIDAKVPRSQRARVPLVLDRRGIVWVVGHCIDERVKVTGGTRRLLVLRADPDRA